MSNMIVGGIGFNALYDSNLLNDNTHLVSDYMYNIKPRIGFQQTRQRLQWSLDGELGVALDQRLSSSDTISKGVSGNLAFALARHLMMQVREDYVSSSDPFFQMGQTHSVPALGGAGLLNPFVGLPAATTVSNLTTLDLAWQIGPQLIAGASGSYSTLHFQDVVTGLGSPSPLIDTESRNGRVYVAHSISPRQSLGIEADVQDLRFGGGSARTISNGVFAFDEITLPRNLTVSLFAGPQETRTHNTILLNALDQPVIVLGIREQWAPVFGGNFVWQTTRTALRLTAQRTVSDGGGLAGALHSNSAMVELLRNVTPRWIVSLDGTYFDGHSVLDGSSGPVSSLHSVSGRLGVARSLTPNLMLRFRYQRLHQSQGGAVLLPLLGDHNRIEFGFDYLYRHPRGS